MFNTSVIVGVLAILIPGIIINIIGFSLFDNTNTALMAIIITGCIWSFLDVYVLKFSRKTLFLDKDLIFIDLKEI